METRDKYYNYSPMMIPAPITDYNAGDRINKQFPNTCGPYPDTGGCGEAVTTFSGVITGNTSDIVENGIKVGQEFEVEWDMAPGMPTYPMFTYENPANMFLLSRGKSQPVNPTGEITPTPSTTSTTTTTQTAGMGGTNMVMLLVVGGFLFYAYNKGWLK